MLHQLINFSCCQFLWPNPPGQSPLNQIHLQFKNLFIFYHSSLFHKHCVLLLIFIDLPITWTVYNRFFVAQSLNSSYFSENIGCCDSSVDVVVESVGVFYAESAFLSNRLIKDKVVELLISSEMLDFDYIFVSIDFKKLFIGVIWIGKVVNLFLAFAQGIIYMNNKLPPIILLENLWMSACF